MEGTRGGPGGAGKTFWAAGVRGTQGGAHETRGTSSAPAVGCSIEGAGGGSVPARFLGNSVLVTRFSRVFHNCGFEPRKTCEEGG